jgi:hypothetical protein
LMSFISIRPFTWSIPQWKIVTYYWISVVDLRNSI